LNDLKELAVIAAKEMQCNCDLDNWEPEKSTGHSWVCRIHKFVIACGKVKGLTCACCGQWTAGRQWFNQDTGYGLCRKCAEYITAKEGPEYTKSCYGIRGIHYDVEGEPC
jgi:hypothetical protein